MTAKSILIPQDNEGARAWRHLNEVGVEFVLGGERVSAGLNYRAACYALGVTVAQSSEFLRGHG
jgi:hypothetical protein